MQPTQHRKRTTHISEDRLHIQLKHSFSYHIPTLDKLFKKYNRGIVKNYHGFLSWNMPWFWEDEELCCMEANIQTAFRRAIIEKYEKLPFDLYIWASRFGVDKMILLKEE